MDREQNIQERSEAETRKKRRAQNSGRRLSPEQLSQQQQLATTRRHGLCYTSQVAPKVTSIKTNVTRCRKEEGKTREVVKVQRLRNCFFFFSCGSGSVLERKRYVWRKATKAHSTLAEENSPADHKRTHAEIARKGQQRSQDTGTLHWNRMKDSAVCLCKAEGRFSKHRSGWSKPPTIISGEIQKIKTKKKLENPTTKQGS